MFGLIELDGAFVSVAPGAKVIDGAVARHREQPRAHRTALGIEAADAVPHAQKGLLHQILGHAVVPDHAQNQPEYHLAVAVVELRQRLWIAPLQADQQGAVALRHNCEDQRKHTVTGDLRRSKDYSRSRHPGSPTLHTRDGGNWMSAGDRERVGPPNSPGWRTPSGVV